MRTLGCGCWVVGCLLVGAAGARADNEAEARAVLDRAIKAVGGEAKVALLRSVTWKSKGTFEADGQQNPYSDDVAVQGFDRYRGSVQVELNGQTITGLLVTSGDQGWIHINGQTQDATKQVIAVRKDLFFALRLAQMLLPLKDKEYRLSHLGELPINGRPTVGIRGTRQGQPDVNLFFDKDSGLPVKSESRYKGLDGQEHSIEYFLSDHKDADGVKHFMKVVVHLDGNKVFEAEVTELKPQEKLEASLFDKP